MTEKSENTVRITLEEARAAAKAWATPENLAWLDALTDGVEHANFFETRATEYSKAATTGNWNDVWSNFDQRRKAKAGDAANEGAVPEDDGEDMFKAAGIAAE